MSAHIRAHRSVWLGTSTVKLINMAVHSHRVESNNLADMIYSFRAICNVLSRLSRTVRCQVLNATEAVCLGLCNTSLCCHGQRVQWFKFHRPSLRLPASEVSSNSKKPILIIILRWSSGIISRLISHVITNSEENDEFKLCLWT